ncbi:MAG: glycosyltransferase family 2 protein [Candidatus Odinarchaeota archaeon]
MSPQIQSDAPPITVLIPARNSALTISRAIESILSQTLLPQKIVVVNDQSTDKTEAIVQSYTQNYPGVFTVVQGPGEGAGAARQAGLNAVETKYVAFLDSDDWYAPNALETLYALVDITGVACGAICKIFSDGRKVIQQTPSRENIRITHSITRNAIYTSMSSIMFRTEILRCAGGFDENLVRMEDLDLHLRATRITDYYFTPKVIAYYTAPDTQSLNKKAFTYAKWEVIVWRKHGYFHWTAFLRDLKSLMISIILVPRNITRRIVSGRGQVFNDVYVRILLGYIAGLVTKAPLRQKKKVLR